MATRCSFPHPDALDSTARSVASSHLGCCPSVIDTPSEFHSTDCAVRLTVGVHVMDTVLLTTRSFPDRLYAPCREHIRRHDRPLDAETHRSLRRTSSNRCTARNPLPHAA